MDYSFSEENELLQTPAFSVFRHLSILHKFQDVRENALKLFALVRVWGFEGQMTKKDNPNFAVEYGTLSN